MAKMVSKYKEFTVPYNKHKYSDLSDTPRSASRVVRADTADDAGNVLAAIRSATDTYGIRTPKGGRYYIGMIHWKAIERRK